MTPSCQDFRDRVLENRGSVPTAGSDLRAHLDQCAECAGFARRTASICATLSRWPRLAPPQELDGRAVAALQAGHREDRIVGAVRGLARLPAPPELVGRALEEPNGHPRAPAVLDRLVDEDLRGSSAALARRFAGRLDRRPAPQILGQRLQRSGLSVLRPNAARRSLLAAAVLVLFLGGSGVWLLRRTRAVEEADFGFEVRYESDVRAMDPMARSLLAGLSGGLADLGSRNERSGSERK